MWCNVLTRPNLCLQWSSSPSIAAFYNGPLQTLRILQSGHRGELLTNILVTRSSPPSTSEMRCSPMQQIWKIWSNKTKEWNECLILPKLRPSICFLMLYQYSSIPTYIPSLKRLYPATMPTSINGISPRSEQRRGEAKACVVYPYPGHWLVTRT